MKDITIALTSFAFAVVLLSLISHSLDLPAVSSPFRAIVFLSAIWLAYRIGTRLEG